MQSVETLQLLCRVDLHLSTISKYIYICLILISTIIDFRHNHFERVVNLSTVDVETPTNEDFDWLTMIIKEFVEKTGSEVGETILKDWQNASRRFVKVYW